MSRSPFNSPRKKSGKKSSLAVPKKASGLSGSANSLTDRPISPVLALTHSPQPVRKTGNLFRRKDDRRSDGEGQEYEVKSLYVPPERPKHFSKVLAQIRDRARMPSSVGRRRSKTLEVQSASATSGSSEMVSKTTRAPGSQVGLSSSGGSTELSKGRSNTALSITDEENTELDSLDGNIGSHDKECSDEVDAQVVDSEKLAHAIERLKRKIAKTKEQILQLQEERDESVKEYLESTEGTHKQKVKTTFEKKNQKTNATIAQLQRKLQKYHKALVDLEENGTVSSGHLAKEVLKGVKENIRGISGGVKDGVIGAVTKPLEIANLIKNRFGSAENVSASAATSPGPGSKTDGMDDEPGSPSAGEEASDPERIYPNLVLSPHYNSDDDSSSIASATHTSMPHQQSSPRHSLPPSPPTSYEQDILELRDNQGRLLGDIESMRDQMEFLARSLQEQRFKSEHLQCQLNDLTIQWNDMTELHQNEMMSLKQELERAEERMECVEYRLSERAGEMEEALDSYVTRISKVETVQQQNQQMVGALDDYLDQSVQAKALLSKFLSVLLAVLAIVLIIFTTVARIVVPFMRTRGRVLMTSLVVITVAVLWKYQDSDVIMVTSDYVHQHLSPLRKKLSSLMLPILNSFYKDEHS